MSLSDYSSDDSLDEEPALGVEAIKSVARSARTGGPSSMNTSNKSLAAAALAGIAVAGIAAGSLLLRKYFKPSGAEASRADGNIQGSDAQDTSDRKDLRRKRPVGGDVKESPRQSAPFMTRTESTSSVGPLRKQPRRETSEDSEGGDASGASPKGGTTDGHRRPLRKTPSANSRHRRPPRRGAGPSASSPAGTGSESESNRAVRAAARKREAAPQPPAAAAKPAPEKAGPAAPTDLMAKHRGGEPSAVAPQEASRGIEAGSVSKAAEEPAASQSEAASANGSVYSTEGRADGAKADAAPKTSKLDAKAAPFDPLGMDAEANDSAEVSAQKEAGNGHVAKDNQAAAGEEAGSLDPQNQAESNVDLNLAVALRIVSEKGNLAAAERTLQKSLGTVREAGADPVRPHFRSRLAGTLADIIARAEQTAAMAPGKNKKDNAIGRRAEIVDLLSYAFEAAKETGDGGLRARESWRLGAALAEAEDFEAAHALFQEELAHWEERAGPADPRTQHSRTWLADVLVKLDRKEEAHKLLTDAAESLEKEAERAASSKPEAAGSGSLKEVPHGEDSELPAHDLTPAAAASVTAAKCYVHLATMQDADGEFDAAAGNARKAVTIMEGTFGEASPRASTAYGTLASVLKHQGKEEGLREALGLYETLQRIAEAVHGLRNSHAAMAHRAIADVHLLLNEHGEAVSHTEKAVQVAGAVHGRDHPVMESYWRAVAEAKQAAGDKEGAKDASRQALRVRSHSQRGGHGGGGGGGRGGRGGGGSAGRRGRGRR
ncbi:hypothetical protein WJX75_009040 [Coccomyxa subellipsoidea]|uniref:MalT-like TPR region domain-containing protein n=1 Tax=Coccomyxa subellipsoidea TaxID=248742 RepID=A0ABR2Z1S6_9CHLO